MAREDRLIGAARNGSTVELYADFRQVAKPLVLPSVLIALVGVWEILRPGLRLFAPLQLFAPLIGVLFLIMLLLLFLLLLVYVRRKPLLLLTPDEIVQNITGGIKIRWSEIAKVDTFGALHGTFVRLFVSDWRAFTLRFGWFTRQGLRLMPWVFGPYYAPLMLDPTHFRMTEAELTRLLQEFIPPHLFVPTATHQRFANSFWYHIRVFEPIFMIAMALAVLFLLAALPLGFLPAVTWSKFFGCVALVFVGLHVIFYAWVAVVMAIDLLFTRRRDVRA